MTDITGCYSEHVAETFTGVRFDLLSPRADQVDIKDIAQGLSNLCRYSGQCRRFYSVAEHSVICYRQASVVGLVKQHVAKAVLLHDAAEAYVGDMIRAVKRLNASYCDLEGRVFNAIAERFTLEQSPVIKAIVKYYDNAVLRAEMFELLPSKGLCVEWGAVPQADIDFDYWPPKLAEEKFLEAFNECELGEWRHLTAIGLRPRLSRYELQPTTAL